MTKIAKMNTIEKIDLLKKEMISYYETVLYDDEDCSQEAKETGWCFERYFDVTKSNIDKFFKLVGDFVHLIGQREFNEYMRKEGRETV